MLYVPELFILIATILSVVNRWGNWDTERLRNLGRVTQPVSGNGRSLNPASLLGSVAIPLSCSSVHMNIHGVLNAYKTGKPALAILFPRTLSSPFPEVLQILESVTSGSKSLSFNSWKWPFPKRKRQRVLACNPDSLTGAGGHSDKLYSVAPLSGAYLTLSIVSSPKSYKTPDSSHCTSRCLSPSQTLQHGKFSGEKVCGTCFKIFPKGRAWAPFHL